MKISNTKINVVYICCAFLFLGKLHAQLGFCQGNSGDPIFTEDFGSGLNDIALPPGTTTYTYANGQPPDDGLYTVTSNTNYFDWFDTIDHTPNDTNGRMLLVNSSFSAGEFYRTTINGLCENTTYEFSSWLLNLAPLNGFCGAGAIPVNVNFEIWDSTDSNLLASGDTGNITGTVTPTWNQYALVFQTIPGQTSVILKMINNSSGGCGNDVAIDDIVFKSCGDLIAVEVSNNTDNITICSSQAPYSDTITAVPDNAVFSSHFYQWQQSSDGVLWTDIVGETNATINITGVTVSAFYRAKVAEFAANLNNSDCITLSDVYTITINQAPPPPTTECWEIATFDDLSCSWLVTGTQPAAPTGLECWETATFNNSSCAWEVTGTQPVQPVLECWETAIFNNTSCAWEVTGTQPIQPTLECWETATFNDVTCAWDVSGSQPAAPTGLECWETASFNNTSCNWEITGTQPVQPTLECWETAIFNNTSCVWEITGTQPAVPTGLECWETATFNNTTCVWDVTGTPPEEPTDLECWETATFNSTSCNWDVTGTQPEEPTDLECWQSTSFNEATCEWDILGTQPLEFRDEFRNLCEDADVFLVAITTIENPQFQWSTGETIQAIIVNSSGSYEVEVTDGCITEIITFTVSDIETPIIESVVSDGSSIVVNLANSADYQFSLDGVDYQSSNIFNNVPTGLYTIFVKSLFCDVVVTQEHFHFYIQKFMTPNDDGVNDYFELNLTSFFNKTEVYIFDRYGKLLFSAINNNVRWDGTLNGSKLPTSDYWYRIVLEGREIKGHFSLKR